MSGARTSAVALLALIAAAAALTEPASAHGWSRAERFMDPTEDGGGGGRTFSGAPGDGLTCAVCHDGGEAPVTLIGLPEDGFEPGASYPLDVVLTGSKGAAALSVTDADGQTAGSLTLPDDARPEARCPEGQSSSTMVDGAESRHSVLLSDACGQRIVSALWTAPDRGAAFVHVALVEADDSEDPTGDSAGALRVATAPVGEAVPAVQVRSSCEVRRAGGGDASWLFAAGLGVLVVRRRRSRRARSA